MVVAVRHIFNLQKTVYISRERNGERNANTSRNQTKLTIVGKVI